MRCLALLLVAALLAGCAHGGAQVVEEDEPPPVAVQVGDKLADFEAEDIDGREFRMSDFLAIGTGAPKEPKAVLVSFFATWCRPCLKELPELIRFQKRNPGAQVLIIVLPPVDMKTRQKLWRMLDSEKTGVMTLFDKAERYWTRFLGKDKHGIPVCIYIEKDGTVAARLVGYHPNQSIEQRLKDSRSPTKTP